MRFTKRCVSIVLLTAMLAIPAFADQSGTVTGSYVYLRSGPGTSYAQVGACTKGTVVTILSAQNGWYQVTVNGLTGYISADYVSADNALAVRQYGTVTGSLVNIRAGAGTEHARVAQAKKGDRVELLSLVNGWYQISTENGQLGYIAEDYIRPDSEAATTPATSAPATTTTPPAAETIGTVTGSVVNLRSAPSTSGTIVATVVKNTQLTVLGSESGWYRVRSGSSTAYIHGDYLKLNDASVTPSTSTPSTTTPGSSTPSASSAEPSLTAQYVVVTGSVVNLRSEASTSSTIVGKAYQGEKYLVAAVSGSWYRVVVGDQLAYLHGDYVRAEAGSSAGTTGTVTGSVVNVRAGAATYHARVAQLKKGDRVTVLASEDGWYRISTENGQLGYVSADYIQLDTPATTPATTPASSEPAPSGTFSEPGSLTVSPLDDTGLITGSYVNLRQAPSTESAVLSLITKGTYVRVTGSVNDDWYRVTYNNLTGYVDAGYLELGVSSYTRPVSGIASGNDSGLVSGIDSGTDVQALAVELCEFAKTLIGTPYVYGGSLPETGFDCSGFTKYVYAHFGITIPRMQQYNAGTRVTRDALQPGDLVFFQTNGVSISHVGMYVGNGLFIHAPSAGRTVCLTSMDSDYYSSRFVCATRILG